MSQAGRTRHFARSARRVRSAKCRVRLPWLIKRLLCWLGLPLPADSSKLESAVSLRNILASMEKYHLRMFVYESRQFVCSRNLSARKVCQGVGLCQFLTVSEWHFTFIFRQESPVLSLSFHILKSSLLKSKYTQLYLKWSKRGFNFFKRPLLLVKTQIKKSIKKIIIKILS